MMRIKGYEDALVDQWQMTRFQAYILYCSNTAVNDRVDIYDFHPLPGDPSKEERRKIRAHSKEALISRLAQKYPHLRRTKTNDNNG